MRFRFLVEVGQGNAVAVDRLGAWNLGAAGVEKGHLSR